MQLFHRIHWEQWHLTFPTIAFFLIVGVFVLVVIKIFRTPNPKIKKLSSLPLDDNESPSHEKRK